MSQIELPKTDSIDELARFWDTHDVTEFEDRLEEVPERAFQSGTAITLQLDATEVKAVQKMAKAKGLGAADLVRTWVLERIHAS